MTTAILLAAGSSQRFGEDKSLALFDNKPIIQYSLETFKKIPNKKLIIVANKDNFTAIRRLAPRATVILGGKTRQESVFNAIKFLEQQRPAPNDLIIIHNAANPFATEQEVKKCLALAKKYGACIVGHKSIDTIKLVRGKFIKKTIPRDEILLAQTPQIFKWEILRSSYKNAKKQTFTDDASIVEAAGHKVAWTQASYANKKITFAENTSPKTLIGIGADFHEFSNSGTLVLAGVKFPKYPKLKADSDGDAILHALSTAISQALGGGSLGTFATAMCRRGVRNSKKYLTHALTKMSAAGYKISNIGIHIETSAIKIDPIANKLRASLSRLVKTPKSFIGITAHTGSKNKITATACLTLK